MLKALTFFALLACSLPAQAALNWANTVHKEKATLEDTETVARFRFTNSGKNTVKITSIHSSCGCTTADLEKRVYAPGESGEIEAVFIYGTRTGKEHKVITVVEEENGDERSTMLEIFVEIPESVSFKPMIQYWKIGSQADARPIVVTLAEGFAGKPVSARMYSEKTNFSVSQPVKMPDGTYHVTVTPLSTDETLTEAGEILIQVEGNNDRKLMFYVSVR